MRLANIVLSPIAARLWPLDAELLKQSACRATGLRNFGDDVPLDVPLALLCRSLNEEVDLHPFGRLGIRHQIVGSLVNRLRLQDLVQRCPEAFAQPVRAPLVVVGPPRSGTTYLHRLMSCDPGLHTAPFWELWEPVPPPNWSNRPAAGDRRVARGRRAVAYMSWVVPAMRTMHELDNEAAEEETIVLTSAFSSILYEWNLGLPSYARWYRSADHTAGYRYLRRVLQAMQWARLRPARWALKAPQHLEQLRPLLRVFPDATVVQLHRDPVATVVSLASFVTYAKPRVMPRDATEALVNQDGIRPPVGITGLVSTKTTSGRDAHRCRRHRLPSDAHACRANGSCAGCERSTFPTGLSLARKLRSSSADYADPAERQLSRCPQPTASRGITARSA